ncbi:MAG TPA: hypothetical protein VGN00_13085 [Puia sp.]|jgi:hypothetical protein
MNKIKKASTKKVAAKKTTTPATQSAVIHLIPRGGAAALMFEKAEHAAAAPNFEFTFTGSGVTVKQLIINGTIIANPSDNDQVFAPLDQPFFVIAKATRDSPGGGKSLQVKQLSCGKNLFSSAKSFDFSQGANASIVEKGITLPC